MGAAALAARRAHPRRQLGGLRIDSTTTVAWGDCVHAGRARVGVVTSATHSPLLAQQIALAPVDVTHAGTGTPLAVGTLDRQQKRWSAEVVCLPHYDPDKTRVRS